MKISDIEDAGKLATKQDLEFLERGFEKRRLNSMTSVAVGEIDWERLAACGADDRTVRLWDARGNRPPTTVRLGSSGEKTFCLSKWIQRDHC